MLDINFIRDNVELVKQAAASKNVTIDVNRLLELDAERRALQQTVDTTAHQRNELAKTTKGKPAPRLVALGKKLKQELAQQEKALAEVTATYRQLLEQVPNIPSEDTPIGPDDTANKILRSSGTKPEFDFEPRDHMALGVLLDVIDSKTAAAVSGSRFVYLKGELVQLQFALIQLALNTLTSKEALRAIAKEADLSVSDKPFVPVIVPVMIKPEILQKMARLEPAEDRYYIQSDDLYLVGSAEHTLGPLHLNQTVAESELPLRYVGYSTSFRREAGSYGRDVKGILRVHQFDKVEIESFTTPDESIVEQDFIVAIQEHLLKALGLPYQVVAVSTGDMGAPDARQIDIETWMPGQNLWRETHSADLVTDYQARRLQTKYKKGDGTKALVHMNDATVFAIGRMLIAIMENYQHEDGSISVPEVLKKLVKLKEISRK